MPEGRYFSFEVTVGERPVSEIGGKDGLVYIETDLNVAGVSFTKEEIVSTKHGEEERQSSPVTPYQVELRVAPYPDPDRWYWFEMYIDGAYVWSKPMRNGRRMRIEGTMDRKLGAFRELLFSLPRYRTNKEDQIAEQRRTEIGTIVIICKDAIFDGFQSKMFHDRDTTHRGQGLNQRSDFHQATKSDCSGGGLLTTATGRELFRFTERGAQMRQMTKFKRGPLREELLVHYRMRQTLLDMGLITEPALPEYTPKKEMIDPTPASAPTPTPTPPQPPPPPPTTNDPNNNDAMKREKSVKREVLKQVDALNVSMEQMAVSPVKPSRAIKAENKDVRFRPDVLQPIKTRVREDIVLRKNEKGDDVKMTRRVESIPLERYVRVDDDIFIVESLDDSVVFVGDDDCYVVEPPVLEFPFVELE